MTNQINRFTYSDYITWEDEIRRQLIDGVVYEMNTTNRRHQEIVGNLSCIIKNYLKGKSCRVYQAPFDVRLVREGEEDLHTLNVVQPDVSVFCNPAMLDDKGAKGVPDWAIEILSPSNEEVDKVRKLLLYQSYGVKEYWIIDPEKSEVKIFKLNSKNQYELQSEINNADVLIPTFFNDLKIDFNELFEQ
ncbi:MAG: Uma2 family endonuclease [Bacteroidia bacterium]